jgi:hypothetical protein
LFPCSPVQLNTYGPLPDILDSTYIEELVDYRVAAIFRNLQHLSRRVDDAASDQQAMPASNFHAGVMAAQYQLLELQDTLNDIISECIRVTLLACLSTTFQVFGSRIEYEHLTNRLRELCCAVEVSTDKQRDLMFWVLMSGTIALFDISETWLREKWRSHMLPLTLGQQWSDAKRLLKTFIWIDGCNEKRGKMIFNHMRQSLGDGREL